MARLLSVNVGLPREVAWNGQTVRTAIWKYPVTERRMARRLNIDGDGQGDLAGHGGEQRAVFVYQMDSYRYWESFLGRNDFSFGQFGENFTIDGLLDDEACIGERYRIGDALFEVTAPRVTCYRIGIRMSEPRMPALLVAHHRPGFYLRVLQEGKIGAGDEIVKIAEAPERITVAETDALLYLPGHTREQLQRALRVPALSPGWQASFRAMLQQESNGAAGNAGLANEEQAPAWPGFKPMRLTQIRKESDSVTSFTLEPVDGQAMSLAQAGQFVVLRLQIGPENPPILRSYSLSDLPAAERLRISVKSEKNGIGSAYLCTRARVGDILDVSAPRGVFTLRTGAGPVVLISAGVGATPVLAMLHALAAEKSKRQVWWIHGARNRANHAFADEARSLVKQLAGGRSCIVYSQADASDRLNTDYDAAGHVDTNLLQKIGVPQEANFYLCGPSPFLEGMRKDLPAWGVLPDNIHMEIFGTLDAITPGQAAVAHRPHLPSGPPGTGPSISFARSGITVSWDPKFASLLELAEACDVPVRWSCRTGVCHTCMTGLIGGSVTYQPEPLERPAAGNVLVCCSRPGAKAVLDL